MQGELGLGTLPALIRALHADRRTGTLFIRAHGCERRVHFKWGAVVFAGSDRLEDRLDRRLRNEGLVDAGDLDAARQAQESSGKRFGECLVELGALTEEGLVAAVERQVRSLVTFLFTLDRGQYWFEETEEPVDSDLAMDLPMQEIILDGIRSMEDPIALQIGVGAMTDYLHPGRPAETANVSAAEGFVLSRVDGRTNILDVLSVSPLSEVETLRSICALLAVGIVEAKPDPLESTVALPETPEPSGSNEVEKPEPTTAASAPTTAKELSAEGRRATARSHYQEGRRLLALKRYHEAINLLTEAVRLDEAQASFHRALGQAYARNPQWRSSAIEHLEEAARLDEFDDETHFALGELYEQEGRHHDAVREFEKVLALEPNHARARQKLEKPGLVARLKALFRRTSRR